MTADGPVRRFFSASYRRKLAVGLLVVFLVGGMVGVGLYVHVGSLLDEDVEQSMTSAAELEAAELNEWLDKHRMLARILSANDVYADGTEDEIESYLQTQRRDRESTAVVDAYLIERRTLEVQTSARDAVEGKTVESLPWEDRLAFEDFDDVVVTDPYENQFGDRVVAFVSPTEAAPGHLLVVTVDAATVAARFEPAVEGGFSRVVDSSGTVHFATDPSVIGTQYVDGRLRAPAVTDGLHRESGFRTDTAYETSRAEDYALAYAPVSGTDWVVLEHAPESQAYTIAREVRTWFATFGFIALVLLLGTMLALGRDVSGELDRLTDRANRIEAGEYDVDLESDRVDEFGDLHRAFASMRDTLRDRVQTLDETAAELQTANEKLERQRAMLSVLNRILRHDVRNDVNVIAGRATLLEDRVDDEQSEADLTSIRDTATGLADLAETTRRVHDILDASDDPPSSVRIGTLLEEAMDEVRSSYPAATIDVCVDDAVDFPVRCRAALPYAVADLVEQLVEYNDGSVSVTVDVRSVASEDGPYDVAVSIRDDGRGLPQNDVRAVETGIESPLRHAEGLALWAVAWAVEASDGVYVAEPDDATFAFRVRRATDDGS